MMNNTIESVDLNQGVNYLAYFSQTVTSKIVSFLNNQGYNVSLRWVSLLTLFIAMGIVYIALKIGKPIIKWVLIIIGVLLILGLIIPTW